MYMYYKRLNYSCGYENTHMNYGLRIDGGWRPQIQDTGDPYYKKPKDLLEGCGCRKDCTLPGKKCKCISSENRGKQCSRLTFKYCSCFKRAKDGSNEDLQLSTRYQNFMDDISDNSHDSTDDLQLSTQYKKLTIDDLLPYNSDCSEESVNSETDSDTELCWSDENDNFFDLY